MKLMTFLMLGLMVFALGGAVAVSAPFVAADGNCGGPGEPPCECLDPHPPEWCKL